MRLRWSDGTEDRGPEVTGFGQSRGFPLAATALLTLVLTGCAVGPSYKRPQIQTPGQFRGATESNAGSVADTKWQNLFPDPVLNRMVSDALAHNFDVLIAADRAEQARAQLGITRADEFPFLNVEGGLTSSRSSTVGPNTQIPAGARLRSTYTTAGAALSWELDLWGRLRRLTEAARARYVATQETRRAVNVSLVASVMQAYFQLLEQDLELDISRKTRGIAEDSLKIVELRRERGAASGLDVRQAEQLLYTATAQIAADERAIAQSENLLSFLQGSAPSAQARGQGLEDVPIPQQMPAGLPSSLIERRPDIRAAEQNLIAANAEIGAARALYLPQISLTAFAGGESRSLLNLVTAPARVYSVAPGAVQSIFRAGQIRNQVRLTEAQERELLITYQRTIYTALREVSDSAIAFSRLREQRTQQEELVRTLEDTVRLSDLRYRGGLDSYLQVLDAQRNLFSGQLTLAQLRYQELVSVVQLYRSLGGGWQ